MWGTRYKSFCTVVLTTGAGVRRLFVSDKAVLVLACSSSKPAMANGRVWWKALDYGRDGNVPDDYNEKIWILDANSENGMSSMSRRMRPTS